LQFIHFGGDEVQFECYNSSEKVKNFMKSMDFDTSCPAKAAERAGLSPYNRQKGACHDTSNTRQTNDDAVMESELEAPSDTDNPCIGCADNVFHSVDIIYRYAIDHVL
jgi:5-keto 4-deoxyuronate isomerase